MRIKQKETEKGRTISSNVVFFSFFIKQKERKKMQSVKKGKKREDTAPFLVTAASNSLVHGSLLYPASRS